MKQRPDGFTLVEMLVTIVIIATLGSLGFTCVQKAREKSKMVTEISAARNLITGYLNYATDHSGQVLAGYKMDPDATNLEGESVHMPMNQRYPFRLAASINSVKGAIFCNENEKLLDGTQSDYNVSLRPNLGLNANLVGGFFGGDSLLDPTSSRITAVYGKFYISQLAEADEPNRLIVFASARSKVGSDNLPGYFQVQPPKMTGQVWGNAEFKKDGNPRDHGFVDFRWDGKAVTAMLGGNVELRTEKELRDMRRWSHQAIIADDDSYVISASR